MLEHWLFPSKRFLGDSTQKQHEYVRINSQMIAIGARLFPCKSFAAINKRHQNLQSAISRFPSPIASYAAACFCLKFRRAFFVWANCLQFFLCFLGARARPLNFCYQPTIYLYFRRGQYANHKYEHWIGWYSRKIACQYCLCIALWH